MSNARVERERMQPQPLEVEGSSDQSDYLVAAVFLVIATSLEILLGWLYWQLHGGNIDNFTFWTSGDKKWLEALFWSLITVFAWNITDIAGYLWKQSFQKRYIWDYIGHTFEAPPISLALVFITINLGIAIGDTTISLEKAPITVIIAFSIIATYFSREAVGALKKVAVSFSKLVTNKFSK